MDSSVPNPQLKNRIFGAILLAILAVLLIPLFLGDPRSSIEFSQPEEKKEFQSKIQPLPDSEVGVDPTIVLQDLEQNSSAEGNEASSGLVLKQIESSSYSTSVSTSEDSKSESDVQQKSDPEKSTEVAIVKISEEKPAEAAKTPDKEEKIEPTIEVGWALQAGIFSKKENAQSIAKILMRHGFKPNSTLTHASFGEATRVWLGPFDSKQKAQERSVKLESIIGNGGYVAPYPFQ